MSRSRLICRSFRPESFRPRLFRLAVAWAAGVLMASAAARAGLVTYPLGEQDFADAAGPILVSAARAAGANEVFPFDGTVFGDDRTRRFGKIHFNYTIARPAVSADGTLTLGLIGLDSPPGSRATVKLFLDGIEQPNDVFAGVSSPLYRSSASVVSVPVPAWMLADGDLAVTIKSFRRSPESPGNAIEADFSTLSVPEADYPPGQPGGTPGGGDPIDPVDPLDPTHPTEPTDGGPGGGNPKPGNPDNGGTPPTHTIPLPPAVFIGMIGLGLAAAFRRRV